MRGRGVIGGDYFCRICRQWHSSAIVHSEPGRVQKIQMQIESLESAIFNLALARSFRLELEEQLTSLRKALNIHGKRITCDDDIKYSCSKIERDVHYQRIKMLLDSTPMTKEQQMKVDDLMKELENIF